MARTRGANKAAEHAEQHSTQDQKPPRKKKRHTGNEKSDEQKADQRLNKKKSGDTDQSFSVPFADKQITCERRGEASKAILVFTHGAGGDISTPATSEFAHGFAQVAPIVLFNGSMNLKNRVKAFSTVADHLSFDNALGGRSMGARAACVSAIEQGRHTKALVLVSFPLVGDKNKESREQVLLDLPGGMDVLFISGTKDSMCDFALLSSIMEKMQARAWLMRVEGADHGMTWSPKASVGEMRLRTGKLAAKWLQNRDASTYYSSLSYNDETESIHYGGWTAETTTTGDAHDNQAKKKEDVPPPTKKRKHGKS